MSPPISLQICIFYLTPHRNPLLLFSQFQIYFFIDYSKYKYIIYLPLLFVHKWLIYIYIILYHVFPTQQYFSILICQYISCIVIQHIHSQTIMPSKEFTKNEHLDDLPFVIIKILLWITLKTVFTHMRKYIYMCKYICKINFQKQNWCVKTQMDFFRFDSYCQIVLLRVLKNSSILNI